MANTLGGVNLAQIAQKSLESLKVRLIALNAFTTDFSADIATEGESVTTRFPTQPSAQDFTATTTAADVTTTARTITLSNYKGVRIAFTDLEWAKSSVNLMNVFARDISNAIASAMLVEAMNKITTANYGAASLVSSAANFDVDDVADLAGVLSAANVPNEPRSLVIGPTYYAALAKDNAIQAAYAFGGPDVIRENRIPRIHGFDVYELNNIPTNSQNLAGFACAPEGMIIAARLPSVPSNVAGEIETVQDPESGLALQVRKWYSLDDRVNYMESGLIWGSQIGVTGNLKIIASA